MRRLGFASMVLLILVAAYLCGNLWLQNRYEKIAMEKAALLRQITELRGQVVLYELENRELASLERILQVAPLLGLDYIQVPRKLRNAGGR